MQSKSVQSTVKGNFKVFYFAIFCIFNYIANVNILTSSREHGKSILKSVLPEVGQYLMQM